MLQSVNKFNYGKYDMFTVEHTLCQVKEKYHDTVCTERLCKKCGADSWRCDVEQQLVEKLDLMVTWSVWQFLDGPSSQK